MKCPKCATGSIRVMTLVLCGCGNPRLFCEACYAVFDAPCGSHVLPPKAQMLENTGLAEAHRQLCEKVGRTQTYGEVLAQGLKEQPGAFPLLEDFTPSRKT